MMHVLLIEDNSDARESLEEVLHGMGLSVFAVGDGYEAVEVYDRHHATIDVAVLDLRLPQMSGVDTARALRRIDGDLEIIAVTGLDYAEAEAQLLGLKAHAVLRKPFHVDELLGLIRGLRLKNTAT